MKWQVVLALFIVLIILIAITAPLWLKWIGPRYVVQYLAITVPEGGYISYWDEGGELQTGYITGETWAYDFEAQWGEWVSMTVSAETYASCLITVNGETLSNAEAQESDTPVICSAQLGLRNKGK